MFRTDPLSFVGAPMQVIDYTGVVPLFRLGRFQSEVPRKNCTHPSGDREARGISYYPLKRNKRNSGTSQWEQRLSAFRAVPPCSALAAPAGATGGSPMIAPGDHWDGCDQRRSQWAGVSMATSTPIQRMRTVSGGASGIGCRNSVAAQCIVNSLGPATSTSRLRSKTAGSRLGGSDRVRRGISFVLPSSTSPLMCRIVELSRSGGMSATCQPRVLGTMSPVMPGPTARMRQLQLKRTERATQSSLLFALRFFFGLRARPIHRAILLLHLTGRCVLGRVGKPFTLRFAMRHPLRLRIGRLVGHALLPQISVSRFTTASSPSPFCDRPTSGGSSFESRAASASERFCSATWARCSASYSVTARSALLADTAGAGSFDMGALLQCDQPSFRNPGSPACRGISPLSTHEKSGTLAPPHSVSPSPGAQQRTGMWIGSETHQHVSRSDDRHHEATEECCGHRVRKALQDHGVHSFPCAAGIQESPEKPSARTMPDRSECCGAGLHTALRNHLGRRCNPIEFGVAA